LMENTMQH